MSLNENYIVVTLDEMEKEVKDILALAKDKDFSVFIRDGEDDDGFVVITRKQYHSINTRIQEDAMKKAFEIIEEYKKTLEKIHDDFV